MRIATLSSVVLVAGCGGTVGTAELVDEFTSGADAMSAEAARHAGEVGDASSMEEVSDLIDGHAARMESLHGRMQDALSRMGGCAMHGSAGAALSDSRAQLDGMSAEMESYRSAHTAHDGVEACREAAAAHERDLRERAERMRGHRGHMMDGMQCAGMGMMGIMDGR